MKEITKKPIGRPSKGPRHSFTIKLDLERAAKLKGILSSHKITGIEYLTPIIEAHLDAIDLDQLRNETRERQSALTNKGKTSTSRPAVKQSPALAKKGKTSTSRPAVKRRLTEEEKLRRAQMLARKVNLLLDSRMDESGRPYNHPAIAAAAMKVGVYISRTRWSMLKNGQVQEVPDDCLRAIATVFGVNPDYLLHEDAKLPTEVEVMLPQVRLRRLAEVRAFAARALGRVDPEGLRAVMKILDQAVEL